jgi:predicted dehydrogenase
MSDTKAKPRALVAGTGFGCRIHVPALRAAGFEVVGLVGADAERTKRRAEAGQVPRAYTDLDIAIQETGATVVSIATTPHSHGPLTLTALARGCHVICEKPFTKDTAEARAVLEAARRADVVHLIGHEFRWTPERALIGRAIAEGLIGEPRFVTITQYLPLLANPEAKMPQWWFDQGAGGGWLGAHGSHMIDQLRTWLGEFASVSAVLPTVSARPPGAEDSYLLRFRMANGAEGVLQSTAGAWGPMLSVSRVAGTKGSVWAEGGVVRLADKDGVRDLPVPPELVIPVPPPSSDPKQKPPGAELGAFVKLCEALRTAMDGKPISAVPLPTFADGLACMEVLDAIRVSAASGGALIALPQH